MSVINEVENICLCAYKYSQKALIDQDDISCVLSHFQHAVILLTDEVASQDRRSQNELLFYKQIFKPLLNLIRSCESSLSLDLIEKHMIVVLNQVCVSIRKSPELLQLCFYISAKYGPSEFVIFSFMIPFYLYKSDQTDFQLISDFQKNQLRPLEMLVTISVFYYTISMQ
ncbi:unnamed protein product [Rotaria magnacalcarata]